MKLSKLLDAYRDAIQRRVYWENNGTYSDERLRQALAEEWSALAAVLKVADK